MRKKGLFFSLFSFIFAGVLTWAAVELGGAGGCGGGTGTSGTTRNLTGSINSSSLSSLTIRSRSLSEQAGLAVKLKAQTRSCTDVQICCMGFDGASTAVNVNSSCQFTVPVPLNNFCYCALVTGSDADGDGCKDDFVAEFGCEERTYSGAIPIFPGADGSTDAINFGTVTIEGGKAVSSLNPCTQVDSDKDGTNDATDTDDDNDGIADDQDAASNDGCLSADQADTNNDNIPDIFEPTVWDGLADKDGNNIPDFCDVTTDCQPSDEDTDGNCIPDTSDQSLQDADGDGLTADVDCDDSDPNSTYECYGTDENICSLDEDGDGVTFCDDCDDGDANNTRTVKEGCEVQCPQTTTCSDDFQCQGFAEEELAAGTPVCPGNEVSCMTCVDGCCVTSN